MADSEKLERTLAESGFTDVNEGGISGLDWILLGQFRFPFPLLSSIFDAIVSVVPGKVFEEMGFGGNVTSLVSKKKRDAALYTLKPFQGVQ